jgi:hypothetical protein
LGYARKDKCGMKKMPEQGKNAFWSFVPLILAGIFID